MGLAKKAAGKAFGEPPRKPVEQAAPAIPKEAVPVGDDESGEMEIGRRRKTRRKTYEGVLTGTLGDVSTPTVTKKGLLGQ